MNFIYFCIRLLISDFIAILLYSIGVIIFALPLLLIGYLEKRVNKFILYVIWFISAIPILFFNLFFWSLLAAYCVSLTYSYSGNEGVEYNWLYWIYGFISSVSLIGYLQFKERRSSDTVSEIRSIHRSSLLWSIIVIISFVVFAFTPKLMDMTYGIVLERIVPNSKHFTETERNNLNSDDLLELGINKLNNGQYEDAVLILTKAIDENPSNFELYLARGSAKTFIGNQQGLFRILTKSSI